MERAYWQQTPMGDFVIAYTESDVSAAEVIAKCAEQATEMDRFFVASIKRIHGIDVSQILEGSPPETVGEWVDPDVSERRRGFAFCAPLIAGQVERGRAWAKSTFADEGMTISRRALGENLEVATLVETPQGPVTGVYLEGDDPFEANRMFATSSEPFNVRFRQELSTLYPPFVDFNKPVEGVTEIFNSGEVLKRA